MSAKQSNRRNRINAKQLSLCALFTALCLIVGYIENLLSLHLAVALPGVKLGLSNAVALTLICYGDKKSAWTVNITRIFLSALLFGSPISLLLSLSGGIASTAAACFLSKLKSVSEIGISITCGVVHNTFQLAAAMLVCGTGVIYYLPVLLVCGAVCGAVCGIHVKLLLKKISTNQLF